MADVATDYTVLIGLDERSEATLASIVERLAAIEGASAGETEIGEAMGMSSRQLAISIAVSFATSIAANFATKAIEDALADLVADGTIVIEEVVPELPTENPRMPRVALPPEDEPLSD